MEDEIMLKNINILDNEGLEEGTKVETDSNEVQLLAIISKKEYACYAIKIKDNNYLMFTDNDINKDLIKSNENIVVVEDSQRKDIKLFYGYKWLFQKSYDNITVTLCRYGGNINPINIIKYDDNYFNNSKNNSLLKDYEAFLKELIKDIENKTNSQRTENFECIFYSIVCFIAIILTILSVIFPKFGKFLEVLFKLFECLSYF